MAEEKDTMQAAEHEAPAAEVRGDLDPKRRVMRSMGRIHRLEDVTHHHGPQGPGPRGPHGGPGPRGPQQGFDPHRGQGRVLALLALKPEMTQREMSHILDMRRQSLGELLGKLERDGLVEREQSEQDKRVLVVRLTEAGKAEAAKVSERKEGLPEALDCLTADELDTLGTLLERVADAYYDSMPDDFKEHEAKRREMKQRFMEGERPEGPEPGDFPPGEFPPPPMPPHGHGPHGHGHGPCGPHGHGGGHGRGHGCGKHDYREPPMPPEDDIDAGEQDA